MAAILFKDYVFQGSSINGNSMYPTLHHKDYVTITKLDKTFEVGDIVTMNVNDTNIIKRIIAIEGERVKIENGQLHINDQPIDNTVPFDDDFPEYTVEEGHFFALGDNYNNSSDSRYYGTFRYSEIDGKVTHIVRFNEMSITAVD